MTHRACPEDPGALLLLLLADHLPAGGALCLAGSVIAEVTSGNLAGNSLKPLVVMQQATLTVSNTSLTHNYALPAQGRNTQEQPGGALMAYDSATLLLQQSLLHNNSAGVGGALLAGQQTRVSIRGCNISMNVANGQGASRRTQQMLLHVHLYKPHTAACLVVVIKTSTQGRACTIIWARLMPPSKLCQHLRLQHLCLPLPSTLVPSLPRIQAKHPGVLLLLLLLLHWAPLQVVVAVCMLMLRRSSALLTQSLSATVPHQRAAALHCTATLPQASPTAPSAAAIWQGKLLQQVLDVGKKCSIKLVLLRSCLVL